MHIVDLYVFRCCHYVSLGFTLKEETHTSDILYVSAILEKYLNLLEVVFLSLKTEIIFNLFSHVSKRHYVKRPRPFSDK